MTDAKLQSILNDITIIVDTREQENSHIIKYLEKNNIKYIVRKLEFADYSFIAPAIPEMGFYEPISFETRIAVERKASLDELSGNLSNARERFERELTRAKEDRAKLILMIERSWSTKTINEIKESLKAFKITDIIISLIIKIIAKLCGVKNGWLSIMEHEYNTNFNEKSFVASLFSFKARYGIEVEFIENKMSGWYLYQTFYYFLRQELKQMEVS